MAGTRLLSSPITETRPGHKPIRNLRPQFESIILGKGDATTVSSKLIDAKDKLITSAKEKGVENQVSGILRMFASEIKNDIVLLTLERFQHLVENTPPDRLADRLSQCAALMRENHAIADTIPEVVENIYKMSGKDSISTDGLRRIVESGVNGSKTTCPKEISATITREHAQGAFDGMGCFSDIRTRQLDTEVQTQCVTVVASEPKSGQDPIAEQINPQLTHQFMTTQFRNQTIEVTTTVCEQIVTMPMAADNVLEARPQMRAPAEYPRTDTISSQRGPQVPMKATDKPRTLRQENKIIFIDVPTDRHRVEERKFPERKERQVKEKSDGKSKEKQGSASKDKSDAIRAERKETSPETVRVPQTHVVESRSFNLEKRTGSDSKKLMRFKPGSEGILKTADPSIPSARVTTLPKIHAKDTGKPVREAEAMKPSPPISSQKKTRAAGQMRTVEPHGSGKRRVPARPQSRPNKEKEKRATKPQIEKVKSKRDKREKDRRVDLKAQPRMDLRSQAMKANPKKTRSKVNAAENRIGPDHDKKSMQGKTQAVRERPKPIRHGIRLPSLRPKKADRKTTKELLVHKRISARRRANGLNISP
jgi:hypothetical protein